MTQQEINIAVAKSFGHVPEIQNDKVYIGIKHDGENLTSIMGVVDYCNRAKDAWKVISMLISSGCFISFGEGQVRMVTPSGTDYRVTTDNPLEGVMIAYLQSMEDTRECSSQKIDPV
jgi:hypothetical protein